MKRPPIFTFNAEKKAEKALAYAEERLAEVEAVTKEKNSNAIKTAIAGYEKDIALAVEASKKIKDEALTENTLIFIAGNALRHQAVLSDVLNNVPEEAKAAIEKASEVSRDQHVQALEFILERKQHAKGQQKEEAAEITSQTATQNQEHNDKKKNEENRNQAKAERRAELAAPAPNVAVKIKPENNSEKQNKEHAEIENLKREIENLKKKQTAQHAPVATPSSNNTPKISSLPNGAVVELNEKGDIIKYIKQPDPEPIKIPNPPTPQPSVTPAPQTTTQNNAQLSEESTPVQKLLITSVNVSTERTSAKIEWETNKPTKSKILVSGNDNILKVFYSVNGVSTLHFATVTDLLEGTIYSYEIEAVFEGIDFVKKNGRFETLLPPPVSQPEKPILISQPILTFSDATWPNQTKIVIDLEFTSNLKVHCGNSIFATHCIIGDSTGTKITDFFGDCDAPRGG